MTLQAEAKHNFLAFLGAPAGAIHHPEEIWLDPAHAPVGEITVQGAVPDGVGTDRWPIGLIDDNRCRVVVRQDMPTCAGPARVLDHIPFSCEVHGLPPRNAECAARPFLQVRDWWFVNGHRSRIFRAVQPLASSSVVCWLRNCP